MPHPEAVPAIHLDDHAVTVTDGRHLVAVSWPSIRRVIAFKRDELTTDLICLDVQDDTGNPLVEIHENMKGWERLLDELTVHLPGAMSARDVYLAVARPAFASNATVVYERDAA